MLQPIKESKDASSTYRKIIVPSANFKGCHAAAPMDSMHEMHTNPKIEIENCKDSV
jgi:hypothetical protein